MLELHVRFSREEDQKSNRKREAKNCCRKHRALLSESNCSQRHLELLSARGASASLTVLPLKEHGFQLSKQEFWDALALRYNRRRSSIPVSCVCGKPFSADRTMVCDFWGSPTVRHNEVRDLTAELLTEGGAVANRLRRRTSDQTVLGSNPAVAAALSPWTRLYTPIVPRRSLHFSFY